MNFLACSCVHEQAICPYMTLWHKLETRLCPLVDNEIIRKRHLHGHQIFYSDFVLSTHRKSLNLSFIMCVLDIQHNCRCRFFLSRTSLKIKSWKNKKVFVRFNLKVTNYGSMKTVQNKVPESLAANTYVVAFALRSKALYSLVMTWSDVRLWCL